MTDRSHAGAAEMVVDAPASTETPDRDERASDRVRWGNNRLTTG